MFFPDDQNSAGEATSPGGDGSFTGDAVNEYSIGDGTSDQGFEPGQEKKDDEFRHGNDSTGDADAGDKEDVLAGENEHHAPPPTHGLVEEGPGPDA